MLSAAGCWRAASGEYRQPNTAQHICRSCTSAASLRVYGHRSWQPFKQAVASDMHAVGLSPLIIQQPRAARRFSLTPSSFHPCLSTSLPLSHPVLSAGEGCSADMAAAGLHSGGPRPAALPAQQAGTGNRGCGQGRVPGDMAQLLQVCALHCSSNCCSGSGSGSSGGSGSSSGSGGGGSSSSSTMRSQLSQVQQQSHVTKESGSRAPCIKWLHSQV